MRAPWIAGCLLLPLSLCAQDLEDVTRLKEAVKKQEARIASENQAAETKYQDEYRAELDRIARTYRAGGQDAEAARVKQERARFEKELDVPDPSPPTLPAPLLEAQAAYRNKVKAAALSEARSRLKLTETYIKRLDTLQHTLTVANRIDDATAVRGAAISGRAEYARMRERYKAMPRPKSIRPVPPPTRGVAPLHTALRNGLELYLSFDTEPGDQVHDGSGHQRHGAATGLTWLAQGKSGGAVQLDGKGGVTVPYHEAMNMPNHFTLSAWFNLKQSPSEHTAPQLLVGKESVTRLGGWSLEFGGRSDPPGALVFRMYRTDARIESRWGEAAKLLPGRWYHAAVVFDGEHMITYLDGREEKKTRWDLPTTGSLNPTRIGFGLAGRIDEVMVHSRALNKTDVSMLYRAKR